MNHTEDVMAKDSPDQNPKEPQAKTVELKEEELAALQGGNFGSFVNNLAKKADSYNRSLQYKVQKATQDLQGKK